MALTFRTAGAWGAGVGRNLHPAEPDENFWELLQRVMAAEAAVPIGGIPHIVDIRAVGQDLYFDYSDYTTIGPVHIPTTSRWNFIGAWQPSTDYVVGDGVTANGAVYEVVFAHHSALTFDPGANDGSGHDFYKLLLAAPAQTMAIGGSTGQALVKASDTDFDTTWASSVLPAGGTTGQMLTKSSGFDYATHWVNAPTQNPRGTTTTILSSSSYSLVVADAFKYFRCTASGSTTITIPTNLSQAFPIDTEITFVDRLSATAQVTFTPAGGVLLNKPDGFQAVLLGHGAVATLKKVDTDEWDLFGLLMPV